MKYVDDINMKFGGEGTKLYSTAGTSEIESHFIFEFCVQILQHDKVDIGT